jgi:hypothetical protein
MFYSIRTLFNDLKYDYFIIIPFRIFPEYTW